MNDQNTTKTEIRLCEAIDSFANGKGDLHLHGVLGYEYLNIYKSNADGSIRLFHISSDPDKGTSGNIISKRFGSMAQLESYLEESVGLSSEWYEG